MPSHILLFALLSNTFLTIQSSLDDCSFTMSGLSSNISDAITDLNLTGSALECQLHFVPRERQTVMVTIQSVDKISMQDPCLTLCNSQRCFCVAEELQRFNHIVLMNSKMHEVACLCGKIQEKLPFTLKTTETIAFHYMPSSTENITGHYANISYVFQDYNECGPQNLNQPSGIIFSNKRINTNSDNGVQFFNFLTCTWIIHNHPGYEIILDMSASGNGNCSNMNITVQSMINITLPDTSLILSTFCSGNSRREFHVDSIHPLAIIKLLIFGKHVMHYKIVWEVKETFSELLNNNVLRVSSDGIHIKGNLFVNNFIIWLCFFFILR